MTTPIVPCAKCKHYSGGFQSRAYKRRIPRAILMAQVDHTKPHKGDHGIRFEAIDGN